MGCSSCSHSQMVAPSEPRVKASAQVVKNRPAVTSELPAEIAGASKTNNLVHLRYKGGGMAAKRISGGCKTCGGSQSRYQVVTTEQIMFVSEDAPNGIFKQVFSVGHDYYVTEEQAKFLLKITYKDMGGRIQNKFEEIK